MCENVLFFPQLRNLTVSVLKICQYRVLGIHRFVCFIWKVCEATVNTVCTLLYCITTQCKHYRGSISHSITQWNQCSQCDVFYLPVFIELYHICTHTHTHISTLCDITLSSWVRSQDILSYLVCNNGVSLSCSPSMSCSSSSSDPASVHCVLSESSVNSTLNWLLYCGCGHIICSVSSILSRWLLRSQLCSNVLTVASILHQMIFNLRIWAEFFCNLCFSKTKCNHIYDKRTIVFCELCLVKICSWFRQLGASFIKCV